MDLELTIEPAYIPSNKLWRLLTDSSSSCRNHLLLLSFGNPKPPLETRVRRLLECLATCAISCTSSNDSDSLERRFTNAITSFRCKSSWKPNKNPPEKGKCECHWTASEDYTPNYIHRHTANMREEKKNRVTQAVELP